MSRGVVLYAVNNERINYIWLAVLAAKFVYKNMPNTKVSLITDQMSFDTETRFKLNDIFDQVIISNSEQSAFTNTRVYRDTAYHSVAAKFKNENRVNAYELSPYDETLLIDVDYFICNNALSHVWGSDEDIMINKHATDLFHEQIAGNEKRINPLGIPMYWATVIYFRKSHAAETMFKLADVIKQNWDYFADLYGLPGNLFRNDYAFSIAVHMLNGFDEIDTIIPPLPLNTIMTVKDADQLYKMNSPTSLTFFANDAENSWKFYVSRLNGINVHCMNKISILNNLDDMLEMLK